RADVEEHQGTDVDDADLDELVDGVAEQAGGDEDQCDTRPPEERGEVEASRPVVEPDAEERRDPETDERTDDDRWGPAVTRGGGRLTRQEERGLDTLADDRDEGQDRQRVDRTAVERPIH